MNRRQSILVVDDDKSIRFLLAEALAKDGYEIICVSNGVEAIDIIKRRFFPVVIMDVRMPKMGGLEAIKEISKINPDISFIVLTAYGGEQLNLKDVRKKAFAYFTKPFDLDKLRYAIRSAIQKYEFSKKDSFIKNEFEFGEIIGESVSIREVREFISKVAESDVTVLVQGESGTGKELVARAIHQLSNRREKPFIPITCSAIPDNLLESELFGYEKGAFTDAKESKPGKFELAHTGTLFLDELGDMNLTLQAKLLRVLEEREVEALGSVKPIKVDVRIVSATNKDLYREVMNKNFREDLYYRLNIAALTLPPLRQRKEDIPMLLENFINKYNKKLNRHIERVSIEALECLINYKWSGNIRELENVLQRSMVIETSSVLSKAVLEPCLKNALDVNLEESEEALPLKDALKKRTERLEKEIIQNALNRNNMNREFTAKELKISRKTLYNKIKEYGLE